MEERETLKIDFIAWFERCYPGERYKLRRGRRGEWTIIRENGTVITFAEYWAEYIATERIIGGGFDGEYKNPE